MTLDEALRKLEESAQLDPPPMVDDHAMSGARTLGKGRRAYRGRVYVRHEDSPGWLRTDEDAPPEEAAKPATDPQPVDELTYFVTDPDTHESIRCEHGSRLVMPDGDVVLDGSCDRHWREWRLTGVEWIVSNPREWRMAKRIPKGISP